MRCLVIGATGYIGALLVPRLLADGHVVRCLARDKAKLARLDWAPLVEARPGDVTDPRATRQACRDVDVVFYLVHSMTGPDFAARDRIAAGVLGKAARDNGVARIVYLSGLQPDGNENSEHLRSRREVGEVLLASGVPTAVLQAGVVVGSGSASFEMIRHLADAVPAELPVLPMPDRAWNAVQPIGIDDLLHHLAGCVRLAAEVNRTFDIGGPEVLSYRELVTGYAAVAGRRRPIALPVPVAAPRLAARLVEALTPVDRHLAGPLLESMAHDLACAETDLADAIGEPPGGPTPYHEAVRRALDPAVAAPGGSTPADPPGAPDLVGEHVRDVHASADVVWSVIAGMGGDTGWYTVPGAWTVRGWLDSLLGGVGARRGRPPRLAPGAALDWWRVEDVVPGEALRLRAEMKLPGTAWLELRAEPQDATRSRYVQRVTFRPDGLCGRLYWYAQLPAHDFLFAVMARTVAGVAADRARAGRRRGQAARRQGEQRRRDHRRSPQPGLRPDRDADRPGQRRPEPVDERLRPRESR